LRRDGHHVAHQADLGFADEEDRAVMARLRFANLAFELSLIF